jgi:tripartite-type tricarboxylate transporter receptor subunit TctC
MFLSPKSALSSFPDLMAELKAKPGQVRVGSTGIGAIVHVGWAMFESAAGVKALHVPYAGIGPVYADLMAGTLDFSMATPPLPDYVKVIASAGPKRNPGYPNTPTFEEFGIRNASWEVWYGFMGPPGMPKPIADRLTAELSAVMKDPAAIARYEAAIKTAPDKEPLIGEAFKKQALEDYRRWKTITEREKITAQ